MTDTLITLRDLLQSLSIWFPVCVQDRVEVNSGHLKISNLALEDSGMYQCVAENKHGTIYFNAELRVQGEQKICVSEVNT